MVCANFSCGTEFGMDAFTPIWIKCSCAHMLNWSVLWKTQSSSVMVWLHKLVDIASCHMLLLYLADGCIDHLPALLRGSCIVSVILLHSTDHMDIFT